ncbi:hypothetical protein GCM10010518_01050 [Kitasatospora cinereorecta]
MIELRDPDILETVLIGVVDAGANVRTEKELRARARTADVAAARQKRARCAAAAGVRLGPVVPVRDVDSEQLQNYRGPGRHDGSAEGDLTPGKVTVPAGVVIRFSLMGS